MSQRFSVFSAIILGGCILLTGCFHEQHDRFKAPVTDETLARGATLVNGLAACGFCHGVTNEPGVPLSGGRNAYDVYGAVAASNITPSKSGIGAMTDEELVQSIRGVWSQSPDKRSPAIHRGFEWMSTSDALSIVSYLRSTTPVKNEVKPRIVGFTARNSTGMFSAASAISGHIADIPKSNQILYGKYIVNHVARCGSCHTFPGTLFSSEKYLAGNTYKTESGMVKAPALIGDKKSISNWAEADIHEFLKAGIRPDKSKVNSDLCPTKFFRTADAADIQAIVFYLRSLS